jgi:glycosyltransferase involved in cell wall biosynthesis
MGAMTQDWQAGDAGDKGGLPRLSIILPCFNEEKNIAPIHQALSRACKGIPLEILFVDDGSSDRTCEEVNLIAGRDPSVRLIRFVRNAGHQHALRAGYRAARGQWVLTMDADMQHPPEAIPEMLAKAQEGYDVVQMVRAGSQAGLFKNLFSRAFYKIFNSLSEVPILEQASDFRLISRHVCDVLNALPERNLIVRAILPYLGFRTASLPFQVAERLFGKAGYSFGKSLSLGSQAIFSFSALPLKLAMRAGFAISVLAFVYGGYNVAAKFLSDRNVPGYTDLIASSLFLGGLILIYLGILGRYILVILDHLKRRPEYLIAEESLPVRAPAPMAPPGPAPAMAKPAPAKPVAVASAPKPASVPPKPAPAATGTTRHGTLLPLPPSKSPGDDKPAARPEGRRADKSP